MLAGRTKRPRVAAFVAIAALAALAACTGGGSTNGAGGVIPTLTTPTSVSPADVHVAPMAKTVVQPASAMTSKHPSAAIQPLGWSQIPGSASSVVAAADGSLWALSDQPAGADKYIWHYAGGTWTNIAGLASQLAAAPNGTLYAINSGGGTYAYSGGSWSGLGGGAVGVTAASDNSVYVLSSDGKADHAIWHYTAGAWAQAPGSGLQLAASFDAGSHVLSNGTIAAGGFYILNSVGAIYYENTGGGFVQLPGNASSIAPTTYGGVFVLGYPANAGGNTLYYDDLDSPGWSTPGGAGVGISSNAGTLYVVGSTGGIYKTAVATPTPVPTQTPTTAPTSSGVSTPFPTPSATPDLTLSCNTSSQRCGVQRWHTKTLDDVDENRINWTPNIDTVTQLTQLPVPVGYNEYGPSGVDNGRFAPNELQVFTVRALLIKRKHETGSSGDDDYHVEIADPDNPAATLVTEAPHGTCTYACASGFGSYFDGIRSELDTCFGAASSSFQSFPAGVIVNFTGVGFFDGLHGQTGALPNPGSPASNFELHPLIYMEFVSGKPTNVPGC